RRGVAQSIGVVGGPEAASRLIRCVRTEAVFAQPRVEERCDVGEFAAAPGVDGDAELVCEEVPDLIDLRAGVDEGVACVVEDGADRHLAMVAGRRWQSEGVWTRLAKQRL